MIKDLKEISEEEMLKNWALAEATSTRRWKYLGKILSPEILGKVKNGPYEFSEKEWQELLAMIRQFRSPLLDELIPLNLSWYEGKLPMSELGKLEMINHAPFVNLAGSKKLIDLAHAFEKGEMPPNHPEFAENLEQLKVGFSLDKMAGKPILVSLTKQPPYELVEGFTRISAVLINSLNGKSFEGEMPVILGVGKQVSSWKWF